MTRRAIKTYHLKTGPNLSAEMSPILKGLPQITNNSKHKQSTALSCTAQFNNVTCNQPTELPRCFLGWPLPSCCKSLESHFHQSLCQSTDQTLIPFRLPKNVSSCSSWNVMVHCTAHKDPLSGTGPTEFRSCPQSLTSDPSKSGASNSDHTRNKRKMWKSGRSDTTSTSIESFILFKIKRNIN
jgi:hypothetical protein